MMVKTAYLLISDLHDHHRKIDNRFNYPKEIEMVKLKIIDLIQYYKNRGYRVILIFLGDIFDRSYKDPDSSALSNNYFIFLRTLCEECYSLLGNHETTYYRNNPFYTLITEMGSEKVKRLNSKVWQPKGILRTLRVVDRVEDGNVVFHFNHHKTPISKPEFGKYNIGLYHQDIVCRDIITNMFDTFGNDVFSEDPVDFKSLDIFDGYEWNVFAHLHKVYGKWILNRKGTDIRLFNLASLGRPNVSEVNDRFLERNIPAFIVENGIFVAQEDNLFNLPCRAECVKEEVVQANEVSYERRKVIKELKQSSSFGEDPVARARDKCSYDPKVYVLFDELLNKDMDSTSEYLMEKINSLGGLY